MINFTIFNGCCYNRLDTIFNCDLVLIDSNFFIVTATFTILVVSFTIFNATFYYYWKKIIGLSKPCP